MALGRSFEEALHQSGALAGAVRRRSSTLLPVAALSEPELWQKLEPTDERLFQVAGRCAAGRILKRCTRFTTIDRFFLRKLTRIIKTERQLQALVAKSDAVPADLLLQANGGLCRQRDRPPP